MSHIIDHLSIGICVSVTIGELKGVWGYVQDTEDLLRCAKVRFIDPIGFKTMDVLIHYQYLQIVDSE
jgi:hypothetical protein